MIKLFRKILFRLNSIREDQALMVWIYFVWLVFTLVFIGYFGFLPSLNLIQQKYKTETLMISTLESIKTNRVEMERLRSEVTTYSEAIREFKRVVPASDKLEDYIVSFASIAGSSGFKPMTFSQELSKAIEGRTALIIKLEGSGNLEKLVSDTESLSRLSRVEKVEQYKAGLIPVTTLTVSVYKLETR